MTTPDPDRKKWLMMGALDGELTPADQAEWESLLAADATLRQEFEDMKSLREATKSLAIKSPPDEIWTEYWTSVYQRLERGVGWVLVSVGAIVLLSYGVWRGVTKLMADTTLPWFAKAAVLFLGLGLVILLVSVIREKVFVGRHDPFKDVAR